MRFEECLREVLKHEGGFVIFVVFFVAFLVFFTHLSQAKPKKSFYFCVVEINKCRTVTLPVSGKCKVITFYGRKIKLCASAGEGNA